MKKFSIIVPVYNVENYLKECIDSILKQSFKDYELILVDDGSSDRSLSICEEYALKHSHISIIQRKNGGAAAARNTGIKAATGKYLVFVDSDDYIINDCLTDINKTIEASNADVIIGKYEICRERESDTRDLIDCDLEKQCIDGKSADEFLNYIMLKGHYAFSVWKHVIKRDLIEKGGLYFYEGINYEDEEWCPRMLCTAESYSLLEKPFYCYRIRHGSVTEKISVKDSMDKISIAESLYTFSQNSESKIQKEMFRSRASHLLFLGMLDYQCHDKNERKALYKFISNKKDLITALFQINKNKENLFKLLIPFSKIFFPPYTKQQINKLLKKDRFIKTS